MKPMEHVEMRNCIRIVVLLACAALAACSGGDGSGQPEAAEPQTGTAAEGSRPARTLDLPGGDLPPGHPPLEGQAGTTDLGWRVPEGWITEQPASSMRIAQYRVPGSAGDGECVVFYFGPGQGGDPAANARRWAGQFTQPDGRSSLELMTTSDLESTAVPVQLVEVTGTYDGGMSPTEQPAGAMEGYMLLGAIVQGSDAPWFFKLTGPEATLRDQREAFVGMLESIRPEG